VKKLTFKLVTKNRKIFTNNIKKIKVMKILTSESKTLTIQLLVESIIDRNSSINLNQMGNSINILSP
jgi:hypothetical protein